MSTTGSVRKKRKIDLTAETFDQLLGWLDHDRDRAGRKYEQIRASLIKIFWYRGCAMPEELADETIDRVAGKIQQLATAYEGDPALYFYGVANNVSLEYLKRKHDLSMPLPDDLVEDTHELEDEEQAYQCLEQCMSSLSARNRELVFEYYGGENGEQRKIDRRKELARRMGIGTNALWIRVHRVKKVLRTCVSECLVGRQSHNGSDGPLPV
ncbi:MAG TPA: hypothetical protein VHA33_22915 [Candidatus Angelobacter sp.]|nr:hypothetical protein [Candidatus Angelobacter sp.]